MARFFSGTFPRDRVPNGTLGDDRRVCRDCLHGHIGPKCGTVIATNEFCACRSTERFGSFDEEDAAGLGWPT